MGVRGWAEKYPPPFEESNKIYCDKCTNTSPAPNFGNDNTKTYYKVIGNEQQLNIYIPYNIKAKNTKINMCMSTAIPIKYCPWCGRELKKE